MPHWMVTQATQKWVAGRDSHVMRVAERHSERQPRDPRMPGLEIRAGLALLGRLGKYLGAALQEFGTPWLDVAWVNPVPLRLVDRGLGR